LSEVEGEEARDRAIAELKRFEVREGREDVVARRLNVPVTYRIQVERFEEEDRAIELLKKRFVVRIVSIR